MTGELIMYRGAGRGDILWRNKQRGPAELKPYRLMFLGKTSKLLVGERNDYYV